MAVRAVVTGTTIMRSLGLLTILRIRVRADVTAFTGLAIAEGMQGRARNLGKPDMAIAAGRSTIVENVPGRLPTQCRQPTAIYGKVALTAFVRSRDMRRWFALCLGRIVAGHTRPG